MRSRLTRLRIGLHRRLLRIDRLTDKVTAYKMVLYFLLALLAFTMILSLFGSVPFDWHQILVSTILLTAVCRGVNILLARRFNVPVNIESDIITALILALILTPPSSAAQAFYVAFAGAAAIASKYLVNIGRKHIFNPAAFGAVAAGLLLGYWPSWWVGTEWTLPLIAAAGFLMARKLRRLDMVGLFLTVYIVMSFTQLVLDLPAGSALQGLWAGLTGSSLLFFTVVMLTEPLTSPKNRANYLLYAALVAVLYSAGGLGIRPEEALLVGNLAAFFAEPNPRRVFRYAGRRRAAEGIETFVFDGKKGLRFEAGQYMEWTLPQYRSDARGNRRYMTISSAPTESEVAFTVRIPDQPSRFKQSLLKLRPGDKLVAGELSGRFVLPKSEKTKLAWLAGGVGITPFRSMAKYMHDFDQQRDVVLLYFAGSKDEFAFQDVFSEAEVSGLKTFYSLSADSSEPHWKGLRGRLDKKMLEQTMPDYTERTFYVSGPYGFVSATQEKLYDLGISPDRIITDYFPGYS